MMQVLRLLGLGVCLSLMLAACSPANPVVSPSGVGDISVIEIGISDTDAPELTFPLGLTYPASQVEVAWPGDGDRLVEGQPLLLDIYVTSLADGKILKNTFDGLPASYLLKPELLGADLYQALLGQQIGARLVSISPRDPADPNSTDLAIIVDVLPHYANGKLVAPSAGLPMVKSNQQGEPVIEIPENVEPPVDLSVSTLIQGKGPQISPGVYVLMQYKIVKWADGGVYESTWPTHKAPYQTRIGLNQTLRALEDGLLNQTVGSRVMIVAPEEYAYPGEGTLIFVIDILDIWDPEAFTK